HDPFGLGARGIAQIWIGREVAEGQVESLEHRVGEALMGEAAATGAFDRAKDRGAQLTDLEEVVEVASLERRVLSVVGERQQLARLLLEGVVGGEAAQPANSGEREDGGGGAAALA